MATFVCPGSLLATHRWGAKARRSGAECDASRATLDRGLPCSDARADRDHG
jgi:hypothetical protein